VDGGQSPQPFLRASDLSELGTSKATAYRHLAEAHERISRGLYRSVDLPSADWDLLEISARAQRATLCLTSALAWHELTDEIPAAYDLAIPRGAYAPVLRAPTSWHRFDATTYAIGRESHPLPDEPKATIWIYSAERTLADMFRLRPNDEESTKALRTWLNRRGSHPSTLVAYAAKLPGRTTGLVRALTYLTA
jgi:hypothetical protein